MNRAQLLLNDNQNHRLREMANREGKSISEIVRQILDEYFKEQDLREQTAALEALRKLDQIREASAKYGVYVGNPVEEVREERDQDMEQLWRQSL